MSYLARGCDMKLTCVGICHQPVDTVTPLKCHAMKGSGQSYQPGPISQSQRPSLRWDVHVGQSQQAFNHSRPSHWLTTLIARVYKVWSNIIRVRQCSRCRREIQTGENPNNSRRLLAVPHRSLTMTSAATSYKLRTLGLWLPLRPVPAGPVSAVSNEVSYLMRNII